MVKSDTAPPLDQKGLNAQFLQMQNQYFDLENRKQQTCEDEVGGGDGVSGSNPLHWAVFVGTG